jgi:hypothetical protein
MARTQELPAEVRAALARQIGPQIVNLFPPDQWKTGRAELAESFPVWMLPANALAHPNADLAELALPTGDWHHQVKLDGQARAFARSRPLGADADSWRLTEFFPASLAGAVEEAIGWVDANVPQDWLVRLLVVPAYNLTAFWFVEARASQVLVVHAPQYDSLPKDILLEPAAFLDQLRKLPFIKGRSR